MLLAGGLLQMQEDGVREEEVDGLQDALLPAVLQQEAKDTNVRGLKPTSLPVIDAKPAADCRGAQSNPQSSRLLAGTQLLGSRYRVVCSRQQSLSSVQMTALI